MGLLNSLKVQYHQNLYGLEKENLLGLWLSLLHDTHNSLAFGKSLAQCLAYNNALNKR